MLEGVSMKTFKQCSHAYCSCCTPGEWALLIEVVLWIHQVSRLNV
jgi:hypothetical protein